MKIKNLTDKAFVLLGVFADDVNRAVVIPASGEKSFPKSRLINSPAAHFSYLSDTIEFESDDMADSAMDDEAFKDATFTTKRVRADDDSAKPYMIAASSESTNGKVSPSNTGLVVLGDVYGTHGMGFEDQITFIQPMEPLPPTKVP